jgi:hypothetical protein
MFDILCRFIGILLKYNKTIEYCEHKNAAKTINIYLINTTKRLFITALLKAKWHIYLNKVNY